MDPRQTNTMKTLPDDYKPDTQTRSWFKGLISDYSHDVRGRIMSIKLSIYLLERKSSPENDAVIARLKEQVEDLTRIVEKLQPGSSEPRD